MDDTIAAISTPIGEGALAVVRISGPAALTVADAVFTSRRGRPSTFPTHTVHYGRITRNGESCDQVLLTVMRAPRTYTGEDTVEISCHGSPVSVRQILGLCLAVGARLAQPGEFTKRAFLNGKLDLTQAEAVMDMISAKTELAQAAAARAMDGLLAVKMRGIRGKLVEILAQIEAHLDFSEDDVELPTHQTIAGQLQDVMTEIRQLLDTAKAGQVLRQGLAIAIIGRPNVGKSSLLNLLLGRDRAIVTPFAGTTRDTIDEPAEIRGIPVRFIDTAGHRRPRGKIEELGVARMLKALSGCDLVLHVLDASRRFTRDDSTLAMFYANRSAVIVVNKSDLPRRLALPDSFPAVNVVEVSAKQGTGIGVLHDMIERILWSGIVSTADHDVFVNDRHAHVLRRSLSSLSKAIDAFGIVKWHDIVAQHVRHGLIEVGEVGGETTTDEILDRIFLRFCVGK